KWEEAKLIRLLTTGKGADQPMPAYHLAMDDARAVTAYLRSLPGKQGGAARDGDRPKDRRRPRDRRRDDWGAARRGTAVSGRRPPFSRRGPSATACTPPSPGGRPRPTPRGCRTGPTPAREALPRPASRSGGPRQLDPYRPRP